MPKVLFHYADRTLELKNKRGIRSFIETVFITEDVILQRLDYIFCSDDYLLQINRTHLKHDFYTDIITFDLSENKPIIGEIYISVDRVKDNASTLNIRFEEEALRVIFHGVLHLCGYKDKLKKDIETIRQKENEYIGLYRKNK